MSTVKKIIFGTPIKKVTSSANGAGHLDFLDGVKTRSNNPRAHKDIFFFVSLAGGGAILGHIFPFFMNFDGGKGMACYLGMLFYFEFSFGLIICFLSIILLMITNYVAAATVIIKATNACPVILIVLSPNRAKVIRTRFTALSISSTPIKIPIELRFESEIMRPIANKRIETVSHSSIPSSAK